MVEFILDIPDRVRINYKTVLRLKKLFKNHLAIYLSHIKNKFPVIGHFYNGQNITILLQTHLRISNNLLKPVTFTQ